MIRVNVTFEDDQGETIKVEQRDVLVEFDMTLTPADIAAAEAQNKTVDDLVQEQVLDDIKATLTGQETPTVSAAGGGAARIAPGPAMSAVDMGDGEVNEPSAPALVEQE